MKTYKAERYIGKGRSIGIFEIENAVPEKLHCHEFIEIVYVTAGNAIQRVDEAQYEVERGDVIFINYGAKHSFEPCGRFAYINLCFLPELLGGAITQENALALLSLTAFDEMRKEKNGGKLSFFGAERAEIEFVLSAMLREYREGLFSSDQVIEHYLGVLFGKMLRKTLPDESNDLIKGIWAELAHYIDQNLGEELNLGSLAQKSFYNPSYFSRLFKQKFGLPLSDYVREKRIELAKRLLCDTDLPIDEIIERVGYHDRSAFYHTFSKATGMTPADYRQKR